MQVVYKNLHMLGFFIFIKDTAINSFLKYQLQIGIDFFIQKLLNSRSIDFFVVSVWTFLSFYIKPGSTYLYSIFLFN